MTANPVVNAQHLYWEVKGKAIVNDVSFRSRAASLSALSAPMVPGKRR